MAISGMYACWRRPILGEIPILGTFLIWEEGKTTCRRKTRIQKNKEKQHEKGKSMWHAC
jgi:hypothetical protein